MGIPDGRPTSPFTYYTTDQSDAQGYAERDARLLASYAARFGEGDALKTFQSLHGHEPRSGQVRSFNITPTKTLDLTNMGTMANQFVMTEIVANEMGVKLPENWKWSQVPAAVNQELDDFGLLITDNEAPSWAYLRNRVNVVDAELNRRGLRQQTKEDVLGNLFADWMQKHGYDSVSYMHDTPNGPVKHVAVLQQRATQAGSLSSDPLTPPATVRSGGGTQVPPGAIPVGMAALQTPDWVLARGETSAGRRLIKGVENFRPGQRWGFRSIVDFVNEAVRLEMRRSTTQTSRTHPAHYKPANHVAYTRETQSQINFHEAGHGLEYLLRARLPDVFVPHAAELIALTNRPGSMASDPPASLSPVGQYNYRLGEGVAEWTRLLLTDPATVQNLQVSAAISAAAERFYPGMAKSLRDAARAVNAFQGQDVATRWAMFNAPPNVRPSANELIGAIIRGGEAAVNAIASGSPVSSLDRKITRAIIKQRKETETAYKAALTKARLVRSTNLTPLMSAYNMILSIGAETQLAISGTGTSKGLRIVEEDGSFRYLTGESWTDLRKKVPASKLAQFDQAAWAQESLNRWENGGLEYPGMREGILPEDLKAIVAMAVQDIPNFTRMYKEQSRFHDLILEVKEAGGLISGMDRARMQGARPGYWPLPRVMTAGRGVGGPRAGRYVGGGLPGAGLGGGDPQYRRGDGGADAGDVRGLLLESLRVETL
jgi:hypothetical protein